MFFLEDNCPVDIMAVLKVETDIITSMTTSLIGQAMILVIMCVKTDVIVFIGNVQDMKW
jgi:hypothetical protein